MRKRGVKNSHFMGFFMNNKKLAHAQHRPSLSIQTRGQVTVFIIIAVLIVASALAYFILRGSIGTVSVPASIQPAYTSFLSCLEEQMLVGINILESQGGYIEVPAFEAGSQHMPFSSQLNFLGNPIPYWYYVSGNGLQKEQIPTKQDMEKQLGAFLATKADDCNFDSYEAQGFEISFSDVSAADVSINGDNVELSLDMNLGIVNGNDSASIKNHKVVTDSRLGLLYDSAKKVYDEEQKSLFLENYTIDTLRLYAPVDGVEISCSPQIWNADNVFNDLQEAIEVNTLALNTQSEDKYFKVDVLGVDEEVRFLNSKNWPSSFEVNPSQGSMLISNPVGNQAGLGLLGFCYVPYHFVYDVKYPVLVQVYSGDIVGSDTDTEIFQFPLAVVIENNNPRKSLNVSAPEEVVPELCAYKNTEVQILVKDLRGVPVQANISYECFGNSCNIGQASSSGVLESDFPQCVNGYVVARAPGFKDSRYLFSTTTGGSVSLLMEKIYNKNIQLKIDGVNYNGNAIIHFNSVDASQSIVYPQQRSVALAEGQYEIQVQVYKNSSINVGATISEQCLSVPRSGILGAFGLQEERCFEIEIPSQVISNALSGGGKQDYYILESDLIKVGSIEINSQSLPVPDTVEQIQDNYLLFEENGLDINFR